MNASSILRAPLALGALAALMAATRSPHFGAALPDASVAVFFLGGFSLARARWFALLVGEAALIDQLAAAWGGARDGCITPAYAFLLPAYGALWLAGSWTARRYDASLRGAARALGALAAGVGTWFALANVGFYLFSGYFGEMSALEYAARVAKYFGPYLATAAAYVLLAAALLALSRAGVRAEQRT